MENMESISSMPGRVRKRANKACLACRARKVRCDVSQRGRPCMNCFLDSEACVVVGRASKRQKAVGDGPNSDVPPAVLEEAAGSEHLPGLDGELRGGAGATPEGQNTLDEVSDAGSHEREALRHSTSGLSVLNAASGTSRHPVENPPSFTQVTRPSRHEVPQHSHSSTRARMQQLQWAGEQSAMFGSDVTYSYYAFLDANNLPNALPQDVGYLEMQGCLRLPTNMLLDDFVKQYFLHVHPMLPIINEGDFWEVYGSPPEESTRSTRISLLLFQAMLFAACPYVPHNRIRALGYPNMKATRAALYRRAKLLFDFEAESSPVAVAQAALLLSSRSPSSSHCVHAHDFWLSVAIQHAKAAGAQLLYKASPKGSSMESQTIAAMKRRNTLKRLWWCIVLTDRIYSLCWWKPIQMSRSHLGLHFSYEVDDPFVPDDFDDEIERSRVYNSGAKRVLVQIFCKVIDLLELLTRLLEMALPLDERAHWDHEETGDDERELRVLKEHMNSWYDAASASLLLPARTPLLGGEKDPDSLGPVVAEHVHDSFVLYTNYLCLLYESAMVRLGHYECFRVLAKPSIVEPRASYSFSPQNAGFALMLKEIQTAAFGVVVCLKRLMKDRLSRWLPLNSLACISLPLTISIVSMKLSEEPGPIVDMLRDLHLHESLRGYQPQVDTTDWVFDAVRSVLDHFSFELLERSIPAGQAPRANANAAIPHPSLYLRMAMASAPEPEQEASFENSLREIFEPDRMDLIKSILRVDPPNRTSTPPVPPAPSHARPSADADDASIHQRIAAWAIMDQALSSELGMVSPPELTTQQDARDAHSGDPDTSPGNAGDPGTAAAWKDIADRAFSESGDAREARFLNSIALRGYGSRADDGQGGACVEGMGPKE